MWEFTIEGKETSFKADMQFSFEEDTFDSIYVGTSIDHQVKIKLPPQKKKNDIKSNII